MEKGSESSGRKSNTKSSIMCFRFSSYRKKLRDHILQIRSRIECARKVTASKLNPSRHGKWLPSTPSAPPSFPPTSFFLPPANFHPLSLQASSISKSQSKTRKQRWSSGQDASPLSSCKHKRTETPNDGCVSATIPSVY